MRRRRRFKNPAASTYLASLGISLAKDELARVKKMPISARMAYLKRKMRSGPRWSPTTWAPRAAARNDNLIRLAAQAIGSVEMRRNSWKYRHGSRPPGYPRRGGEPIGHGRAPKKPRKFNRGDKVRHAKWGIGEVKTFSAMGPPYHYFVKFSKRGAPYWEDYTFSEAELMPVRKNSRRKYKRRRNSSKAPEMSAHKYGRDWHVKTGSDRFEGRTIVSGFKTKRQAERAIWAIRDAFYDRSKGRKRHYEVGGRYGYFAVDDDQGHDVMVGLKRKTAKGLAAVLNGVASGYGV